MFLANVNDSFISPQNFGNEPLPAFPYPSTWSDCESIDNCTLPDGEPAQAWTTYYNVPNTCGNPFVSQFLDHQTLGVCLNLRNQTYFKSGCFSSGGSWDALYSDPTCTQVTHLTASQYTCFDGDFQTHCTATPTPIPIPVTSPSEPSAPSPSNALSLQISSVVVLAALLAISTIF